MTPERWAQIDETLQAALEVEPGKIPNFLEERCAGDDDLKRTIQSLLESLSKRGKALDVPAAEVIIQHMAHHPEKALLETGQGLAVRYEICCMLGKGGFAEVYKANDKLLRRYVAIKIFSPSPENQSPDALRRFKQEAYAASGLGHPNIVAVHDIGEHDIEEKGATPFIVTELIEGITLRQRMNQSQIKLPEALNIAIQLTSALRAAHEKGIVHRDIKPENIMLSSDDFVKVFDFGVAKFTRKEILASESREQTQEDTKSGAIIGSNKYMSPEQLHAPRDVDARSDIWAVGVVLYEMIAGRVPFDGPNRDVVSHRILSNEKPEPLPPYSPAVTAKLNRVVFRALSKDREKRYQVAGELFVDLQNLKRRLDIDHAARHPKKLISRYLRALRGFAYSKARILGLGRAETHSGQALSPSARPREDSGKKRLSISETIERLVPIVRTHRSEPPGQSSPPAVRPQDKPSSEAGGPEKARVLRTLTISLMNWGRANRQTLRISIIALGLSILLAGAYLLNIGGNKTRNPDGNGNGDSNLQAANIERTGNDNNAAGFSSPPPATETPKSNGHIKKSAAHLVWKRDLDKRKRVTWAVAFSPDGRTFASGGRDKLVRLWDTKGEKLLPGHTSDVTSIAFSPNGETLASASNDKTILLWEKKNGYREPKKLLAHSDEVKAVAFSPKENLLVSASKDRSVILWDLQMRSQQRLMHEDEVLAIAVSPDGNTLASASKDGILKLWNLRKLRNENLSSSPNRPEPRILCNQCGQVYTLAFSCDGEILVSGGSDNTIWLWNWRSERKPTTLGKHAAFITSLAFSPDCNSLVSASNDLTVRVWDFRRPGDLKPEAIEQVKQDARVTWISFSPEGALISGSYDGPVKLWQLTNR